MDNFGRLSGERCFRNGCEGIITEEPFGDGGCSCHINPPCGHCTTSWARCETCNWKSSDDEDYRPVPTEYTGLYMMERYKPRPLDPRKIDYRITSHSNSSQLVTGVYPEGTTKAEVLALVEGTFGGRWNYFGEGKFEYVAYTD